MGGIVVFVLIALIVAGAVYLLYLSIWKKGGYIRAYNHPVKGGMTMGKEITGIVIEKAYHPPPGAPAKYWCYLMVETEPGERVNVRLHQEIHDRITTGDKIRFSVPWRKNKRLRDVELIERRQVKP